MNNTFVKVVSTVLVAGVLVTFSGCTPKKVYSLNQDASKENVKVIMDARTDPDYVEKLEQDQEQNYSEFEMLCRAYNVSGDRNLHNLIIKAYVDGEIDLKK